MMLQLSEFWWSAARRTTFVAMWLWLFSTKAWDLVPIPELAAIGVFLALLAIYIGAAMQMKPPKSVFSDNIAHASHPSNVALKEIFISVGISLPFLLALAWLAEQMGA